MFRQDGDVNVTVNVNRDVTPEHVKRSTENRIASLERQVFGRVLTVEEANRAQHIVRFNHR
jgi:hypothetical protein